MAHKDNGRITFDESNRLELLLCFLIEMRAMHGGISLETSVQKLHRTWKGFLEKLREHLDVDGFEEVPVTGHFPTLDRAIEEATEKGFIHRVDEGNILCTIRTDQERKICAAHLPLIMATSMIFQNAKSDFELVQEKNKSRSRAVP
jgi:hypothetical protein